MADPTTRLGFPGGRRLHEAGFLVATSILAVGRV
jgi:hypothetical protein